MIFRRTEPTEIDAAYDVIEQARRRIASLGIDQWQSGKPDRQAVAADVERGEGFVVELDGDVCATAMLTTAGERCYDDISSPGWLSESTSANPAYLTVHRFAVADAATGKGLAKHVLAQAEDHARRLGLESVRVDTHEGNTPMRSLLSGCGYAECGIITLDVDYDEPTLERVGYEKLVSADAAAM